MTKADADTLIIFTYVVFFGWMLIFGVMHLYYSKKTERKIEKVLREHLDK